MCRACDPVFCYPLWGVRRVFAAWFGACGISWGSFMSPIKMIKSEKMSKKRKNERDRCETIDIETFFM